MDRTPSPPPPALQVSTEAQQSTISVYQDPAKFMEMVRRFISETAPTNAAATADRGAIMPTLALEPVQQHQPMVATATPPAPGASGLGSLLSLSLPLSSDNPGPCILNMAPDPRSLATSSQEAEMEDAEEVEMEVETEEVEMEDTEEERAIKEGRFSLLASLPPAKRRRL